MKLSTVIRGERFTFADLREVFAKASEEKSGDQLTYFIDTDTLMTIRIASRRLLRGREENAVTDYGDYEKVGGVYFPFESESGPPGASDQEKTKVILDTGEAGVAIDDAKFRMGGK